MGSRSMTWPQIRQSEEYRGRWVALDNCRYDGRTAQPIEGRRPMIRLIVRARMVGSFMAVLSGWCRPSVRFRNAVSVSLNSGHADDAHHAALLMVEDVAVEHPVAGVIGDEG